MEALRLRVKRQRGCGLCLDWRDDLRARGRATRGRDIVDGVDLFVGKVRRVWFGGIGFAPHIVALIS